LQIFACLFLDATFVKLRSTQDEKFEKGAKMKRFIIGVAAYLSLGTAVGWAQPGLYDQNSQDSPPALRQESQAGAQTQAAPDETSLPIKELLRDAESLAAAGEQSRAIALYDEVLKAAPRNPQAYRGRAGALAALGDIAQAQADYNRFLQLDPEAPDRLRWELELLERSGYQSPGKTDTAAGTAKPQLRMADQPQGLAPERHGGPSSPLDMRPPVVDADRESREVVRADLNFSLARNALREGGVGAALYYARLSELAVPRVRNHALLAQAYLDEGDYPAAAMEARAVAAAGPLNDWQTIYGYYDYNLPRLVQALKSLGEYVGRNSSSADAHFLLGYEYLFAGHVEAGHEQIAIASVLQPLDRVAKSLLERQGVEVMTTAVSTPSPLSLGANQRFSYRGILR
jgi:tetratricopeptide (TPR) repeat protein